MQTLQSKDIYQFWIIHNPSGICIFNQTFVELPKDFSSDLTAGYLFAITTLSQEIVQENIRFLQLERLRFVYGITSQLILVLLTKNEISTLDSMQMIAKLRQKFSEKYSNLLERNQLFNTSKFRDFALDVERILERDTMYFHILQKRSENLESFFQKATDEWQSIQNSIKSQVEKMGTWIKRDSFTISHDIQRSLVENREKSKKSENFNQKIKKHGDWV